MKKLLITAHAEPYSGTAAERTRPGQANGFNVNRPAPRPGETPGQYYRRTGQTDLGATSRTRGRTTRITPGRGR